MKTFVGSAEEGKKIAQVVQGIEYPEYIDAVYRRPLHKGIDDIIGVVAIAEDILPPEQHLLRGIRHRFFEFTDPFPGIFI